ncbi:unnamed protein product [Caenorhabditis nigoni]
MSKMSSLSEMPELVMENIIGFSDFRSVLSLRQVCKYFLNFIDRLNDSKLPDSKFSKIEMIVNEDIYLMYGGSDDSHSEFNYLESNNSRCFNEKTTSLKNAKVSDVAIQDLKQVLKFQKSNLESLFFFILRDDSKFSNLVPKLSSMLKKLNRKIKTKMLCIKSDSQSEIMSILPFVDPETLESLDLFPLDRNVEMEMDEIVKTEQWNYAKSIHCEFLALDMRAEDICHFSTGFIKMLSIFAGDLKFLKETFVTSSKFQDLELQLSNFNENEEIPNVWGPAFHFGSWSNCRRNPQQPRNPPPPGAKLEGNEGRKETASANEVDDNDGPVESWSPLY